MRWGGAGHLQLVAEGAATLEEGCPRARARHGGDETRVRDELVAPHHQEVTEQILTPSVMAVRPSSVVRFCTNARSRERVQRKTITGRGTGVVGRGRAGGVRWRRGAWARVR